MKSIYFTSAVLLAFALPTFINVTHAQETETATKVPSILYKRAAFALGADAKNLKISNVEKDWGRIDFDVLYAKKVIAATSPAALVLTATQFA